MKKRKKGRQLSRKKDQRNALLKILAGNLILKEKIKTTRAKAKEVVPLVERIITRAKKQDLSARRFLLRALSEKAATKAFKDLGVRYRDRNGGYTRIVKLARRSADNALIVILELVKDSNGKENS